MVFFQAFVFWAIIRFLEGFHMGQARAKTWFGLAGLAKQELSQLIPVYFRNRPKRSQKFVFAFVFHAWTFELSSTNPLWHCLSSTISQTNVLSSLEDLKTRSHRRGAMRSTKLIQIELNQKSGKHLLTGMIFPLFGFWSCSGLALLKACWNMLESPIGCKSPTEGFTVSFSLLLVFSGRCEHCNYHLQLSLTIMDMFDHNFLAMPFTPLCSCEMCVSSQKI